MLGQTGLLIIVANDVGDYNETNDKKNFIIQMRVILIAILKLLKKLLPVFWENISGFSTSFVILHKKSFYIVIAFV